MPRILLRFFHTRFTRGAALVCIAMVLVALLSHTATRGTTEHQVRLGNRYYSIPSNYGQVANASREVPGGFGVYSFSLLLPDLVPENTENASQFRNRARADIISGTIEWEEIAEGKSP